jgi:hypothetical protein
MSVGVCIIMGMKKTNEETPDFIKEQIKKEEEIGLIYSTFLIIK